MTDFINVPRITLEDMLKVLHEDGGYSPIKTALASAIRALLDARQDKDFCDKNCTWLDHHPDCINYKT